MASHLMLPPGNGTKSPITVNMRTYSCALGSVLTVPIGVDADELEANGWIRSARDSAGTTANRPTVMSGSQPLTVGFEYCDTTLGYNIRWDGVLWRNPATGAAV